MFGSTGSAVRWRKPSRKSRKRSSSSTASGSPSDYCSAYATARRRIGPGARKTRPSAHPAIGHSRTGPNQFTFVSPSTDFRLLDATLLDPGQISGYEPSGHTVAVMALVIGYGSNYLNAFQVEDRLVLNNGSHRAFALREHGITHAPCILQHISRREEIEVVASGPFKDHPDRFLKDPRPPVLKDYFDAALRKLVHVPRKRRMIKASFGFEQADIPAEVPQTAAGAGPH